MGIMRNSYTHVIHPFPPFSDGESRILILGSFPSVRSRETGFYYGHKQNRFWKVLSSLRKEEEPLTLDEKKAFLKRNHIALYDVIQECDIIASSDSSVRNAVPSDLKKIVTSSKIRAVFCNGTLAAKLYEKYQKESLPLPCYFLPSTSAANAAMRLEDLERKWAVINDILEGEE